jgi:TonB-linked SusC/RagA family outer membrane protein
MTRSLVIRTVTGIALVGSCTTLSAQSPYTIARQLPTDLEVVQQPNKTAAVTLIVRDSSLKYVVHEIARQVGLRVLYDNSTPLSATRISVRLIKVSPMEAYSTILKGTGFVAKLSQDGHTVLIRQQATNDSIVTPKKSAAAPGQIIGRIVDSSGRNAIAGVTVAVQGTNLSVLTSTDGEFTLRNVPQGKQVLVIKLFGYKSTTRTVTIVDETPIRADIALVPIPTVLSGVVTTAAGKQRRMEIGNDITTLKVDSIQQVAPVSTVADLLEARVPGVQVIRSSGQPGSPRRIRLRGTSSINGNNDPIVIVDGVRVFAAQSDTLFGSRSLASGSGVRSRQGEGGFGGNEVSSATPSPLDQIDINSIETIEVFKGPSATSMYGSDAANGVIVITTKRGRVGRPTWTFNVKQSREYIPGKYPNVVMAFGHYPWAISNNGLCPNSELHCLIDSIVTFQALNEPNLTVLGTGHGTDVSMGVQGGVSSLTYSFTGSGARQLGLLRLPGLEAERYRTLTGSQAPRWMRRPDRYQTWGGTGTLSVEVGRSTRTTITSSLFSSDRQQSSLDLAIGQLVNTYIDTMTLATEPLIRGFYERGTAASLTSNTSLNVASNVLPWFPISATLGLNVISRTDKTLVPRGVASGTRDSAGFFSVGRGNSTTATIAVVADQIPLGRFFTASVGVDVRARTMATLMSQIRSIPIGVSEPQTLGCPSGAASIDACGQSRQNTLEESTFGWFIQPKLAMNSRFFVMPGVRLDGGSASGGNAKLTGFPKLNFSWIALDRSDQPLWGAVTMLRPRLAMGMAGVQPGPADKLRLIADSALSFEENTSTYGAYVSTIGNTMLRPERSREIEGGFDLELWHNRLSVQVTQYHKDRHDAIIDIPVAMSVLGGRQYKANIGRIRNLGTELTVSAAVLESSELNWTVNGSLSKNSNKVLSLAPDLESITASRIGGLTRIVPGYPLFSRWALPILGYRDWNGNGRLDETEILVGDSAVYLGAQEPNFSSSFNSNLTWRRFSLHATFHYTDGLNQVNRRSQDMSPGLYNPSAPLGAQAISIALQCNPTFSGSRTCKSTEYGLIQTVNVLRFNSLSLRYAVPVSMVRRIGGQALSVALQGENLGMWTNYRGKDPNVNAFSTGNLTADTGQLPQPRKWVLNVVLTY